MIERAGIYWADLGQPEGSSPAKRRPVLVVQADTFNESSIRTVLAVAITSNTRLATMPGNVFLPAGDVGLPKDSVANVSQLVTLNRYELVERAGGVPSDLMMDVDRGLALVLGL
ncbi:type II toxin-antitoxin system PemK/MazF family toxin [Arthrobacter sp. KK5.5]|uniref:type II toxin-antitoxin system PemK/MazF family toxin n=1 Tax=Arthrobacter sp. KK5.5 TaxID=3373084 RepID=UPI003EE6A547